MTDKALLDASVLVPISLCDILLRVAEAGLFQPRWTDEIMRETRRGVARRLIRRGLEPEHFMPSVDRRISSMQGAFRRATVAGWEQLVDRIALPDPDDRHVVAAAIKCGASVIVTQNLRHFPAEALPARTAAESADTFLLDLLDQHPAEAHACIEAQAADTGKHGKADLNLATTLKRLAPETPLFVSRLRQDLLPDQM